VTTHIVLRNRWDYDVMTWDGSTSTSYANFVDWGHLPRSNLRENE